MSKKPEHNSQERELAELSEWSPESTLASAMAGTIGGRSPREMNQAHTVRLMRGSTTLAAAALVLIVATTSLLSVSTVPSQEPADSSNVANHLLFFEEEEETETANEGTILTAVLVEGMSP